MFKAFRNLTWLLKRNLHEMSKLSDTLTHIQSDVHKYITETVPGIVTAAVQKALDDHDVDDETAQAIADQVDAEVESQMVAQAPAPSDNPTA